MVHLHVFKVKTGLKDFLFITKLTYNYDFLNFTCVVVSKFDAYICKIWLHKLTSK